MRGKRINARGDWHRANRRRKKKRCAIHPFTFFKQKGSIKRSSVTNFYNEGERRKRSAFHAIYIYVNSHGRRMDSSSIFSFLFVHKSKFLSLARARINKERQPSKHVQRFRVHSRNAQQSILTRW